MRYSGVTLANGGHLLTLSNGSLAIVNVRTSDTGNYTCRAENRHGADEIVISLVVQGTLCKMTVLSLICVRILCDCLVHVYGV